jgi:hypothetical protein
MSGARRRTPNAERQTPNVHPGFLGWILLLHIVDNFARKKRAVWRGKYE